MARPFPINIQQQPPGKLSIEEAHPGYNAIYFIPPEKKLAQAKLDSKTPTKYKRHILDVNGQNDYITIYPLNTLAGHRDFLAPKYKHIKSITLDGFGFGYTDTEDEVINLLEELPSAFVKDYDYGLGLQKDYRFLIHTLEDWGIQHLVISKEQATSITEEAHTFTLQYNEFEKIRRELNKITREAQSAARKIKSITANNLLSFFLNDERYPQKTFDTKDSTLAKLIAKSSSTISVELSKSDQKTAVELVSKSKKAISQNQPETLVKLHDEIELVALETLIDKYEQSLPKNLKEPYWQKLFNENPFILALVFGYPVIKIQEQAFVGGRKITGTGDKITDFLVKNSLTNNTAIFEIKTPKTKLLNKNPYRDGVYTPCSDLSGSVNQLLDQQYQFQRGISALKETSRIYDIETYSVQGVLVIGQTPEEVDQQKSFELFRGNSKTINIVTFDELLGRLKQLHIFLNS